MLRATLTEKQKEQFALCGERRNELLTVLEKAAFIRGFNLGVRIANRGSFRLREITVSKSDLKTPYPVGLFLPYNHISRVFRQPFAVKHNGVEISVEAFNIAPSNGSVRL